MDEVLFLRDADDCERVHRLVVLAVIDGEPAEDIVASFADVRGDGQFLRERGPVDGVVHRLVVWRRRVLAHARRLPAHDVDKMIRVIQPFAERLEHLPSGIDIASVGPVGLVDRPMRRSVAAWPDLVERRDTVMTVFDEIRVVMGTLERARLHLELGRSRLRT